jgi:hypothetical protein
MNQDTFDVEPSPHVFVPSGSLVRESLTLAAGLGKLVGGLLYRVSPYDPFALGGAAVVLATSAVLASYLPARPATRVVPLDALRSE